MVRCRWSRFFGLALAGLTLWLLAVATAVGQVSLTEREALIDLYQATGGDEWHNNEGWLGEEGSECDWHGVHCWGEADNDAYVSNLLLPGNGLSGELPESLAGLERVRRINLRANQIGGPVPPSLAELPDLDWLDLGGNRLTGPVPGALLDSPGVSINLRDNQLDGYTDPIETPQGSISLDLSGNPIGSLPPASWRDSGALSALELNRTALSGEIDFGDHPWPGLSLLSLEGNTISSVTPGILPDLRHLYLADNDITGPWPVDGLEIPELQVLDLTGNGLESSPIGLSGHPALEEVYLGRNTLHGQDLAPLFAIETLRTVELHNNPLQALPSNLPGEVSPLLRLKLASAELAGDPPEWFGELSLRNLDLSGNHLAGDLEPWLTAVQDERWVRLDLSRNGFEGPVPQALMEIDFAHRNLSSGPGLNLCWNHFDQPFEADIDEFLTQVHIAGNPSDCNDRELADIDLSISGSWYNPERSGKGYTVMLLDNGELLHYWFGYPPGIDLSVDQQMWSFQVIEPVAGAAIHPPSLVPYGGRFGHGVGAGSIWPYGQRKLEMVRRTDDSLSIFSGWHAQGRHIIVDPPLPPIQERLEHVRLTELAGTTCNNQSPFQEYSGAWYNPDTPGEGFILEVLPDDRGLVYWFTYAADGSGRQAWMIGDGHFEPNSDPIIGVPPPGTPLARLEIEELIQPVGTVLGPNFDGYEIDYIDWGSLVLEFVVGGTAHVGWSSEIQEYGSGGYPLERLARPMLAECE